MRLRITQYGEPVLRQPGVEVTEFGAELRALAEHMLETMYAAEGIGLAAQQIDEALMLCVVDVSPPDGTRPDFFWELDGRQPPLDLFMPLVLLNPKVTPEPEPVESMEEGCLSFPDIRGVVERPERIRCDYQDLDGAPHVLLCDGILARCIQHEVDHLNGVLFIDRMTPRVVKKIETRLKKLKRETKAGR